jgi:hypothetical protein
LADFREALRLTHLDPVTSILSKTGLSVKDYFPRRVDFSLNAKETGRSLGRRELPEHITNKILR